MEKILFINACVRPESRTLRLASQILSEMEGIIEEINLEKEGIKPLDLKSLQERDTYVKNKDFSNPIFQYAKQFIEADKIVIGAPYWDLGFPSTLRVYLEAVTITGVTFTYTSEGCPAGLCKAKKIIYATTAGGAIGDFNLGFDYVKALAHEFYGIPEVVCFKAENLDVIGSNVEKIMEKAMEEIKNSRNLLN